MSERVSTVASDSGNPQSAEFQHQSLLPWPERSSASPVVHERDLDHKTRPNELDLLPDGVDTPYELVQIFKAACSKDALRIWNSDDRKSQEVAPQADAPQPEVESASTGSSKSSNIGPGNDAIYTPSTASLGSHETTQYEISEHKSTISSSNRPRLRLLDSTADFVDSKIKHKRSSLARASSPKTISPVTAQCASCFDDLPIDDVRHLECTHAYCASCLETLVQTAVRTESLFPPKCCLIEIPLKTVLYVLKSDQRNAYKSKAAEYAQPAGERWYCPDPECAKWIPPSALVHRNKKCPHCKIKICSMCRGEAHERGTNCPQDFGLNAVLDEAEREGWRRCYACHSLVEKTTGCRHMRCTCRAQFCYTCGAKWQTCDCTEADQARREEQLRARRRDFDAEVRQEEDEIARAIAEVEALEAREAEERWHAEIRREEEQRREEEELRRLEQERLAEEESRRREAEEAERMRVVTIMSSILERAIFLGEKMDEITLFQQMAILERHESAEQSISTTKETQQLKRTTSFNAMKQKMLTNIEKRSRQMSVSHSAEVMAVAARHEQEDDETFLKVQLHLRGRPNREIREKAMLDALKQAHNDEVGSLQSKYESSLSGLRRNAAVEIRSLEHGFREDQEAVKQVFEVEMRAFGKTVANDRMWFEEMTKRRHELLEQLRLDQLRTMGESRLLETWEARLTAEAVSRPEEDVPTQGPIDRSVTLEVVPAAEYASPLQEALKIEATDQDMAKESTSAGPRTPLPQVTINTAALESSQAVWDAESRHSLHSQQPSTSRFSLTLHIKNKTEKAQKCSKFSFRRSFGKAEMDKETFDRLLRKSVGDAF